MREEKLQLKCWEYVNAVKDLAQLNLPTALYRADVFRTKCHDEICKISGLEKEQTKKYTDRLDRIDYNGTELYLKLLDEIRNQPRTES